MLIPMLFAVAHIAADGEPWNFATGETFSPMFNVVSSYAWRSPAGWAMVACILGFAFVMGFISWHAGKRGPGFLAWFTAAVAAVAMVNLLQVAWYPFKPSREAFSQIQREMKWEPTTWMRSEMWSGGLYAVGVPMPEGIKSPEYVKSLRSHWLHKHGIGWAQAMILLTIMTAKLLWQKRDASNRAWFWANWVVVSLIMAGALGGLLLPDLNGMNQRMMYVGIYLWMLLVVREIERQRRTGAAADTLETSEAEMKNIEQNNGISATGGQNPATPATLLL